MSDTHFGFQTVDEGQKAQRVRGVFDSVASKYDVMNDLMSMGLHRAWKAYTVAVANVREGDRVLDLAGGTGDGEVQFARAIVAHVAAMLEQGAVVDDCQPGRRKRLGQQGVSSAATVPVIINFLFRIQYLAIQAWNLSGSSPCCSTVLSTPPIHRRVESAGAVAKHLPVAKRANFARRVAAPMALTGRANGAGSA